jgi:hypothetical protein
MAEKATKKPIADSILPYPEGIFNRVKYKTWRGVYPYYEDIRDTLLKVGLIRHKGRQPYVLGYLAPGRNVDDFLVHLETQGFGNHFVAWEDDDQVISVRRLDGFRYQYHLRVFKDGEVRGHYEFTPEAHPIRHLGYRHMKHRPEDFFGFCGDWIIYSEEQ